MFQYKELVLSCCRWVWRRCPLPPFVRRYIELKHLYPTLGYIKKRERHPYGPPLMAGFLKSGLGLGEAARLEVDSLRSAGVPVRLRDVSPIHGITDLEDGTYQDSIDIEDGGVLILHVNAPESGLALKYLGETIVRNRPIIGVWAWELSVPPKEWLKACEYLDELWVPSNFVADAFSSHCNLPIRVVPHPISAPTLSGLGREHFGLPEDRCFFLCIADGRSDVDRKNIIGALKAFQAAFGASNDVGLVIKLHHVGSGDLDELQQLIAGAENVFLLNVLLPRDEVGDLVNAVDVLVSLHRSEGFGLTIAEAMFLGKPVIATGYSGPMDFMDEGCAALVGYRTVRVSGRTRHYSSRLTQAHWAEPDMTEAVRWMQELAGSEELRVSMGNKGRDRIQEYAAENPFVREVQRVMREYLDVQPVGDTEHA